MKSEKFEIKMNENSDKSEIIIREVAKVNELEIKAPVLLTIVGIISCVYEFLLKRISEINQINQKICHILVDRENMTIKLVTNENDFYAKNEITGKLDEYPKFKDFGINSGKVWTPTALGLFIKMNRAFFPSKDENMKLVTTLMNFTATVNNSIEKGASERGDRSDKFDQVVNSNLPSVFVITLPLFKGLQPETFEVETFAQVNGREISFVLISPGAQSAIEGIRDSIIDEQLALIREIAPDIAIIEQ